MITQVKDVELDVQDVCRECGMVPSVYDLERQVERCKDTNDRCHICGQAIRIVRATFRHMHDRRTEYWGLADYKYEENYSWVVRDAHVTAVVHCHVGCIKKATPHALWNEGMPLRVNIIPVGVDLPEIVSDPCDDCGAVPKGENLKKVTADAYGGAYGSICSFCGAVIRLEQLVIWHYDGHRSHGTWNARAVRWEPMANMMCSAILVKGHLGCIIRAIPYTDWAIATSEERRR